MMYFHICLVHVESDQELYAVLSHLVLHLLADKVAYNGPNAGQNGDVPSEWVNFSVTVKME